MNLPTTKVFYAESNDFGYSDNEDNINVNHVKTYKADECVICMENKPNVLFCGCGHICICKECIKIKRVNRCLICKTLNDTLRII